MHFLASYTSSHEHRDTHIHTILQYQQHVYQEPQTINITAFFPPVPYTTHIHKCTHKPNPCTNTQHTSMSAAALSSSLDKVSAFFSAAAHAAWISFILLFAARSFSISLLRFSSLEFARRDSRSNVFLSLASSALNSMHVCVYVYANE